MNTACWLSNNQGVTDSYISEALWLLYMSDRFEKLSQSLINDMSMEFRRYRQQTGYAITFKQPLFVDREFTETDIEELVRAVPVLYQYVRYPTDNLEIIYRMRTL